MCSSKEFWDIPVWQRRKVKDEDPGLSFRLTQSKPSSVSVLSKFPLRIFSLLSLLTFAREMSLASPESSRQGAAKFSLKQGTVLTLVNLNSLQRKQTLHGMSVQVTEKHLEEGRYMRGQ